MKIILLRKQFDNNMRNIYSNFSLSFNDNSRKINLLKNNNKFNLNIYNNIRIVF